MIRNSEMHCPTSSCLFLFYSITVYFSLPLPGCYCEDKDVEKQPFLIEKCRAEAAWGYWRCPGEERVCTEVNATRYKCIGGDCTFASPCASELEFQEHKPCVKMRVKGLCVPWWTGWSMWSRCSATCGVSERRRTRSCVGAWSIMGSSSAENKQAIYASCLAISRSSEGVQTKSCPMSRLCANINGAWSQWGHWSACSKQCGRGVRMRTRTCTRPAPLGIGLPCQGLDTQKQACIAPIACPADGYWCPWSSKTHDCSHVCGPQGMGLRLRVCACPKQSIGGKECEVGKQADYAADTLEAMIRDKNYHGVKPSHLIIEMVRSGRARWEACNRQPCPYLRILDEDELDIIVQDLGNHTGREVVNLNAGKHVELGSPVRLECPSSLTSRRDIFDRPGRFPHARSYWTREVAPSANFPLDWAPSAGGREMHESDDYFIAGDKLAIRYLTKNLTGIYRFGYEFEPGSFQTVCFFIVRVKVAHMTVDTGASVDLRCNAIGLWPVVAMPGTGNWSTFWKVELDSPSDDMRDKQYWWFTDLVQLPRQGAQDSYNRTRPGAHTLWDTERRVLDNANSYMNGKYRCVVRSTHKDPRKARFFITKVIQLEVRLPPSIVRQIGNWFYRNRYNLLILFIIGVITSALAAVYIHQKAFKIANLQARSAKLQRQRRQASLASIDPKIN